MKQFTNHPDDLISASLTGELTELERRGLDRHLATCPECRATLEAFSQQRQLLAGMSEVPVPRDLGARVRAGIQSRRFAMPWYRRPAGLLAGAASLVTVAVAALLVVVFLNRPSGPPVGASSPTPTTSEVASLTPPSPSTAPAALPLGIQPGDLVYTQLTGPFDGLKLAVIDAHNGNKVSLRNPAGSQYSEPKRAAISPDGRLLAFATETGAKGTWRIFVTNLADGSAQQLAETWPVRFGLRIAWSPDGRYLAFTVASIEATGPSDVWLYDRTTGSARQLTHAGNAYFASWAPQNAGNEQLWISLGEANPVSQLAQFPADGGIPAGDPLAGEATTVASVFVPLVAPDGKHALYWTGTMASDGMAGWTFSRGGMPQLTTMDGAWSGTPVFRDLSVPQDGQAFSSGELSWAADSDGYAVWGANWTGTPEGNGYPDPNAVYVGRVSKGLLSQSSALGLGTMTSHSGDALYLVDVALSPDGGKAAVTLGIPLPGDLVAPQSYLRVITIAGAPPTDIGSGGANTPPWSGPGVFVPASVSR